jgi:biopolymer transport protein ExbD
VKSTRKPALEISPPAPGRGGDQPDSADRRGVSTTFTRETQLSIDLPEAEGKAVEASDEQIEILIDEAGRYRVNGQGLVDTRMRTLQAAIYKISAGDTTLPMIITADAQAAHEDVVRAMDAAGQMGFVHLSITTRQPSGRPGPGGP